MRAMSFVPVALIACHSTRYFIPVGLDEFRRRCRVVAIELDRHRRFNAEVAPQGGEDGVGVRIAHPKLGIHYYVVAAGP